VRSNGVTETAVLDSFVITAGQANGSESTGRGGGMYNENSSPTLTNVFSPAILLSLPAAGCAMSGAARR